MNSRLLTLDNLIQFYSTKKKSMSFSADKSGEPVVVQVDGKLSFSSDDDTEGLTAVTLQACHTEKNLNKSSISFDTMQNKMLPSFKNRPILGYIHSVDGISQFADHRMHMEDDGEESHIIYDEIAVGIIPESNNAQLVYDEENDRYNVIVDGYLFDEYTQAAEILKREKECFCSVEISIRSMSWDNKKGCLNIEDGFFSGVTILGYNEDGSRVMPGMAGSNIKLKDFSQSNNSMFSELSEDENSKLIETLEKLNSTLSKFNINNYNYGKEDVKVDNEVKVNEEVNEEIVETESTDEVTTENSEETVDTPDVVEVEKCKTKKNCEEESEYETKNDESEEETEEVIETEKCKTKKKCEETFDEDSDDVDDSDVDDTDSEDVTEDEVSEDDSDDEPEVIENVEPLGASNDEEDANSEDKTEESEDDKKAPFNKVFELSFDDIRCSLYALLSAYESANNDWYWITSIYDDHFVYQGMMGDYHGQNYVKNADDTVAFEGEPYNLHADFLTDSELATLTEMRSNYSAIQSELASYKDAEVMADKMEVFQDEAYSAYLETEEFKALMSEETVKQFTKEELAEKADAALGKVVKATKTFAMETKKDEAKKPSFFAFAKQEQQSSFLDGLLKK